MNRQLTASSLTRAILVALILIAATTLPYNLRRYWSYTIDDAYITARYALNAARTHNISWNPGDSPLEGFTHPAWFALMTAGVILGLDPVFVAKCAGIAFFLALLCMLPILTRRYLHTATAGIVAACVLAAMPILAIHALAGLETMGYLFLSVVCTFLACFARLPAAQTSWFVGFYTLLAIAALFRPEGFLAPMVILWSRLLVRRMFFHGSHVAGLAFFVVGGAMSLGLRQWYFGQPLPNPFYVKAAGSLFKAESLNTLLREGGLILPLPILLTLLVALVCGFQHEAIKGALRLFGAAFLYAVPYLFFSLLMNYAYRFSIVTIALALIACALSVNVLLSRTDKPPHGRWAHLLVVGVVLWWAIMIPRASVQNYLTIMNSVHVPMGEALAKVPRREAKRLMVGDAGAIPYYSGWRHTDLTLNDNRFRHSDQSPETYLVNTVRPDLWLYRAPSPNGVWECPVEVATAYDNVGVLYYADTWSHYYVLLRKDASDREAIVRAVAEAIQRNRTALNLSSSSR
jgi:arabinofuranosyltransferase